MRWYVMSGPQLLYNVYVMRINGGITHIVMNNALCLTRLSSVSETTCLIVRPLPLVSMPKVTEIVT